MSKSLPDMELIKWASTVIFSIGSCIVSSYLFIRVEITEIKTELKDIKNMQEKMFDKLYK